MPWITFIQDVRPPGNDSAKPLYKAWSQYDVSEKEAHRCVSTGIAKRGRLSPPVQNKPAVAATDVDAAPKHARSFSKKASEKR